MDAAASVSVSFFCGGRPATKGSTRPFVKHNGKLGTRSDNARTGPWSLAVAWSARAAGVRELLPGPVSLGLVFYFDRPASNRDPYPTKRSSGDVDKLTRCVLDALTGILFADDSQVVHVEAVKLWSTPPQQEQGVLVYAAPYR